MRRLSSEDKAGIYTTVIVHLAVVIVCLLAGLDYSLKQENSFVLDFSKYEEMERLQEIIDRNDYWNLENLVGFRRRPNSRRASAVSFRRTCHLLRCAAWPWTAGR